jgi:hypothetical protein
VTALVSALADVGTTTVAALAVLGTAALADITAERAAR